MNEDLTRPWLNPYPPPGGPGRHSGTQELRSEWRSLQDRLLVLWNGPPWYLRWAWATAWWQTMWTGLWLALAGVIGWIVLLVS